MPTVCGLFLVVRWVGGLTRFSVEKFLVVRVLWWLERPEADGLGTAGKDDGNGWSWWLKGFEGVGDV